MIAWLCFAAFAAEPDALALEDVLVAVEAAHPLLQAARARAEGADFERLAAAGALDPVIVAKSASKLGDGGWVAQDVGVKAPVTVWGGDVAVGWDRGVGDFAPYEGDLATGSSGELYATVDLPVLRDAWTDRRRATLARARREVDVAGADLEVRELELLRTAGHRYWDWVAAGHRVRIAEDLLALAEARDRAFAGQVALGDVAEIVRQDGRRLVLERTDRVLQARRGFEQAAIELSLHLRDADGRRVLAPFEAVPEALSDVPAAEEVGPALARALADRPELDRFDAQLAQADIEQRLATNQALPAVDLLGEATAPLGDGYDEWKVGVYADWPVPARAARGRSGAAQALEDRLLAERRFAEDRVSADVADAASALGAARARAAVAQDLVAVAEIVADAERRRFDLGDSNLIFVNQREIAAAEAEALLVDARIAAQKAAVDWRWAQADLGAE